MCPLINYTGSGCPREDIFLSTKRDSFSKITLTIQLTDHDCTLHESGARPIVHEAHTARCFPDRVGDEELVCEATLGCHRGHSRTWDKRDNSFKVVSFYHLSFMQKNEAKELV